MKQKLSLLLAWFVVERFFLLRETGFLKKGTLVGIHFNIRQILKGPTGL